MFRFTQINFWLAAHYLIIWQTTSCALPTRWRFMQIFCQTDYIALNKNKQKKIKHVRLLWRNPRKFFGLIVWNIRGYCEILPCLCIDCIIFWVYNCPNTNRFLVKINFKYEDNRWKFWKVCLLRPSRTCVNLVISN